MHRGRRAELSYCCSHHSPSPSPSLFQAKPYCRRDSLQEVEFRIRESGRICLTEKDKRLSAASPRWFIIKSIYRALPIVSGKDFAFRSRQRGHLSGIVLATRGSVALPSLSSFYFYNPVTWLFVT